MDIEVRARVNTPFPTNCVTKVETIMEKNEKKMAEIKEANKNDKRKFNIYLSKPSIKEFEVWALLFKSL